MSRNTALRAGAPASGSAEQPIVLSDGSDDLSIEEAQDALLHEQGALDLTAGFPQQAQGQESRGHYRMSLTQRNASLESSHKSVSVWRPGDFDLTLGAFVELNEPVSKWKIEFVEIKSIWVPRFEGSVIIRGLPYARSRSLEGVRNQRNEICQILEVDDDDDRPDEVQGLLEINPRQVLRERILYKTNALYPAWCYGKDEQRWLQKTALEREDQAPLTCRLKIRIGYENSLDRKKHKKRQIGGEQAQIRITQDEASPDFRRCDKELTVEFRLSKTTRGGSYKPRVDEPGAEQGQQYTMADGFCGSGGATRGAHIAKFKIVAGVDHCPDACRSWSSNFPDALILQQDIKAVINSHAIDPKSCPIDLVHLSPPCQPYSPENNGRENEHDPRIQYLHCCPDFLEECRGRGFTFEQTFGLLQPKHKHHFDSVRQHLQRLGFSFRCKVIDFREYGLPQKRKRLVMFGVCPGEKLPPWPPATHSDDPSRGLKPFVTEVQAFRGLNRRIDPLHDVANARACNDTPRDGNKPLDRTILCSGPIGRNHFSGRREYTERELACLQSYPPGHRFEGNKTSIKRQIGNTFPPCVVKVFHEHLRKWWERADGVQRASTTASIIEISDDDGEQNLSVPAVAAGVIVISDDEEEQHSSVSAVAPLLERMSIAPSDIQPRHRPESPVQIRSRSSSVTLEGSPSPSSSSSSSSSPSPSPSPSPGPSRRPTVPAQKRNLDLMHDGEDDEVMKAASRPKRERVRGSRDHDMTIVDD